VTVTAPHGDAMHAGPPGQERSVEERPVQERPGRERARRVPCWAVPREAVERLDREVARLGRGVGAIRLRMGEVLEALGSTGGHHELGFSSMGAYVLERCGRSARWAEESRAVARRLVGLPRLRAALLAGEVSWSMAQELSRHATGETEEALLSEARGMTLRAMRERLGAGAPGGKGLAADEEIPRRAVQRTVPQEDAWLWEATLKLVEHVVGRRMSLDEKVDALLVEGWTRLLGGTPPGEEWPERDEEERARLEAWYAQLAEWRADSERRCEENFKSLPPVEGGSGLDEGAWAGAEGALPRGAEALDALVRSLARELQGRDLELGQAALRLFAADGWRRLGFATAGQYARERAGVSLSSLKSRMTLARRLEGAGELAEAVRRGEIGYEAAQLVGRVVRGGTVAQWMERARERTVKHLREEVEAVELLARAGCPEVLGWGPPGEEVMGLVVGLERRVRTGEVVWGEGVEGGEVGQISVAPAGVLPGAGRVAVRLVLSEDVACFWEAVEALHRRHQVRLGGTESFMRFLCVEFWRTWNPWVVLSGPSGLGASGAYWHIHARDLFRCTSPVCTRSDVTPHHLRFRSHGGGEEEGNLTSLCGWCHLEGVHGGRIVAEPPAGAIRWRIGRGGGLLVSGRRRLVPEA